jgi:hypothetical protein
MSRIFRPRTVALLIVLLVIAALSFGFAASINVTAPAVGEGATTFTDFDADVDWIFDATDPTTGPSACITFSNGVTTVSDARMAVLDGASAVLAADGWVTCDVDGTYADCGAAYHAQCDFPNTDVDTIYGVQIVAGQ